MNLRLIIPCFNDWESLDLLLQQIHLRVSPHLNDKLSCLVINDCSTQAPTKYNSFKNPEIQILNLNRNIGHQRSIAIGLAYTFFESPCDKVIVMDADGEDRPEDIIALIDSTEHIPQHIIFARRTRRHEGFLFQSFYFLYKQVFKLLTGKKIEFGNFCIIPFSLLKNIVYVSEIWNHFSGGVIRSKVLYDSIPLERGKRLAGNSKMNFTSLIIHGMSAVSVHMDTVAVRLLLFSLFSIAFGLIGIFVVAAIRLFTPFAIPGWASNVVLAFSILLFQAFLISLFLIFMVLTYRTQKHFIPAKNYKDFIEQVDTVS